MTASLRRPHEKQLFKMWVWRSDYDLQSSLTNDFDLTFNDFFSPALFLFSRVLFWFWRRKFVEYQVFVYFLHSTNVKSLQFYKCNMVPYVLVKKIITIWWLLNILYFRLHIFSYIYRCSLQKVQKADQQ